MDAHAQTLDDSGVPAADPSPRKPKPKGIYCPECQGVRLAVLYRKYPCPAVRIRYWACTACGCRLKTREVMISSFKSQKRGMQDRKAPGGGKTSARISEDPAAIARVSL